MFEDYTICPYTGLRSFTEEESLYFKGREEHIEQATEQLQRNKFLMLTGASGDGKSSLVYAGIVPNARAGFLKSKYTQWSVADFRPERNPFKNLCRALAKQLDIGNVAIVESELQHGFSALVDLYKNSKCFVDVDSVAWQQADDAQRAALKRKASNLIIIVDQFEEFFTNPENYHQGIPSRDSNLVLNVLLDTARIALEEDLPIYIVFTMRSDYIGQCAAFRSLPEYIGFSQFFVPRLNRSQLQQVIEEPATLSGNTISRRLTERLIHDITEGVDQLPILQHALNQIWHAASNGKEEMDLIHYAMVGGMPVNQLPDEQVERFNTWFEGLPLVIKACYHKPDLQNVLDTHTNKLFEQAADYYRHKTGKAISETDAKSIIKTAFICLTKIDQSRAVRNRMTLKEITNIFANSDFTTHEVGNVLNIFREPGNTFIRPFVTDDTETAVLKDDDVLDITHESLIRNWEYLEEWAEEEFTNYTISLDFEQQLKRWVESDKSNGFLLSIGPLTYFENWFIKAKPNEHWIARYLPEEIDQEKKLTKAKQVLSNAEEFLQRSARRHIVTRTVMRYGPRRIIAVLGVLALLVFSSFAVSDYFRKQNDFVLNNIRQETLQLMNSPKVNIISMGELMAEALQDELISVHEIPGYSRDQFTAIKTNSILVGYIVIQGRGEPNDQLLEGLSVMDSLFTSYKPEDNRIDINQKILKELAVHHHNLELAYLFSPSNEINEFRKKNAARCATYALYFLTKQPEGFTDINTLHRVMEHAINLNAFSKDELQQLITILSPFENADRSAWVLKNYHRDNLMKRSLFDYGFKFNGLFQELAYLYASMGEPSKALNAIDSLLHYNQSYHQNNYTEIIDNASNIAGVFYTAGHLDQVDDFVNGYCTRKNMEVTEFYERLLARSVPFLQIANNADPTVEQYANGNLQYGTISQAGFFSDKLRQAIVKAKIDPASRNFKMALAYKNEGLLKALNLELRNEYSQEIIALYDKAMEFYEKVDAEFLKKSITIIGQGQTELLTVSTAYLFTFPDYRTAFHPFEPRNFNLSYTSMSFINYLVSNNHLDVLYKSDTDATPFIDAIRSFFIGTSVNPIFWIRKPAKYREIVNLEAAVTRNAALRNADLHVLYLYLGEQASVDGNEKDFLLWAKKFKSEHIFNTVNLGFGGRAFKSYADIVTGLFHYNLQDSAYRLVKRFKNPVNRSSLYAYAAYHFLLNNVSTEKANSLLDSAYVEISRIENLSTGQPNRTLISYALALQHDAEKLKEAYKVIKNLQGKSLSMQLICRSYGFHGELSNAAENIPAGASDSDRILFLRNILQGYRYNDVKPGWKEYSKNYFWFNLNPIPYVNESL